MRTQACAFVCVVAVVTVVAASTMAATRASPSAKGSVASFAHTRLFLWPAGQPEFGALPGGGPGTTVVVADLESGRTVIERIPGIAPGDFPVPLLPVAHRLVYNADRGVSAIGDDLRGRPRLLGHATFFVPAATTNRVLLIDQNASTGAPARVRPVSVRRGTQGRSLQLPARTAAVVEGTRRGLLLVARSGRLELWRPGATMQPVGMVGELLAGAGVAADARFVAYATGCRNESATSGFVRTPVGFDACARLQIIDVVTGMRFSMPAPAGTLGWVPRGFGIEPAIAPGDRFIAAEAAVAPASNGRIRVFVVRLGRQPTVTAVPASLARLYAGTAWSSDGTWLFYQGPRQRLRAFDINTGATRAFPLRCCRYTGMVVTRAES